MKENTKYFLNHLPACVIFALAAGVAAWLFGAAADYGSYPTTVKVYSVGWFAVCVLSFYCGLLVVPRSLGIIFSFAGIVAFAILCALNPGMLPKQALLSRAIQSLPAVFFIAAWAVIAVASSKSENKKIRLSSWLWLTIFVLMLACWGSFHFAQARLIRQRNAYLAEAREKTLALAAELERYKETNNAYPPTLEAAGIKPEQTELPMIDKNIKYSFSADDYALTFVNPMPYGSAASFSYDTRHDGWFGTDPEDAHIDAASHIFLGFLRR
ncbi:MAG: hypothetical protein ACYSOF_01975 [Planctomycetota bacterium]|jgi:MFS family permease